MDFAQYLTAENALIALAVASAALPVMEKLATYTKTKVDDEIVHKCIDFVTWLASYVPLIRLGGKK